jgi:hypothetical protein
MCGGRGNLTRTTTIKYKEREGGPVHEMGYPIHGSGAFLNKHILYLFLYAIRNKGDTSTIAETSYGFGKKGKP